MSDERAREILGYLDETMTPRERAGFEARMAHSPELRRQVDAVRKTRELVAQAVSSHPFDEELAEAAIRQLPELAQEATEPNIRTRVGRYHRRALETTVLIAVAVGAAVVALVLLGRPRRPDVARYERMEGPIPLERSLAAGKWVRTPLGSSVPLLLKDGSRVVVRGMSSLLLQRPRQLYLARGEIWVSAKEGEDELVVTAPLGRVTSRGAEFTVHSGDEVTRAAVRRGKVVLHRGEKHVEVAEGHTGLLAEGQEPVVREFEAADPFFGWVDELLGRPAKKGAAPKPPPTPKPAPPKPTPPAPAAELPRQKVLERTVFAEGRSPYVLGLHALLRALGVKVSYGYVAGLSGDPFRSFYSTAGDYYGANLYLENPLRLACGLLGCRVELASGRPWAESWLAIRRCIAAARPILIGASRDPRSVYPTMNWLLLYGYNLDRNVVHFHALDWPGDVRKNQICTIDDLQDAHTNYNGTHLEPSFPTPPANGFPLAPQYRVVAEPGSKPPPRQVAILTALARAIAYGKGTTTGRALDPAGRPTGSATMGLAALELWARHLRAGGAGGALTAEKKRAIAGFGDVAGIPRYGWPLVVLKMARKDAAEFLMEVSSDFDGQTRQLLLKAASAYRDITEEMASLGSIYPSADQANNPFSQACVRTAILVEELRKKEAGALAHLARALKIEASRGRRPLPVPTFPAQP